jgi:hypothetical protein
MKSRVIGIERHSLGPRVHLLGRRVHEYHVGVAVLAVGPAACLDGSPQLSTGRVLAAIVGLLLIVKDWPDLFEATRDKASWRLGLHRLPPGEAPAAVRAGRDRLLRSFRFRRMRGPCTPRRRARRPRSEAIRGRRIADDPACLERTEGQARPVSE